MSDGRVRPLAGQLLWLVDQDAKGKETFVLYG